MFTHIPKQVNSVIAPAKVAIQRNCDKCHKDKTTQKFMEPRFGHDFSRIKVWDVPELAMTNSKVPQIGSNYGDNNGVAETECDVRVHPDDQAQYNLRRSFRTVGLGVPIITYKQNLDARPCFREVVDAHENVHVEQMRLSCLEFRQCVDSHSGGWLGNRLERFLDPGLVSERSRPSDRISRDDYDSCFGTYAQENNRMCPVWERAAYERSIDQARQLRDEIGCRRERDQLDAEVQHGPEMIADPPCRRHQQQQ